MSISNARIIIDGLSNQNLKRDEFLLNSDGTWSNNTQYNLANSDELSNVAFTGSYNDLTNKPTIPTTTSQLTNDSGFITSSALAPYATTSQLAAKANSSDVYLKSDTNTFTMTVTNSSDTTTSYNLINVTGS